MGTNRHPQINIRVPIELKEKLQSSAKDHNISVNAEITRRLSASFDGNEEQDLSDFPTAEEVKNIARVVKQKIAEAIYDLTLETLRKQIKLGHTRFFVDVSEFQLELLDDAEFDRVLEPTLTKLKELGYVIYEDHISADSFGFEAE